MQNLNYSNIKCKTINGKTIKYGFILGNEKIVFIKTGADGNINGYKNKYLRMAHRVNKRIGATVICASNPSDLGYKQQVAADKATIFDTIEERNWSKPEVYMFGTSDGAYRNLLLAKEIPQTIKLVCVNTSTFDFDDLKERLLETSQIHKTLVYGDRDDEYIYFADVKKLNLSNLTLFVIEGADHEFKGMLEEYIVLIDLIN